MQNVGYTTQSGNVIDLAIITAKSNLADHNATSPCYDLDLRINGNLVNGGIKVVIDKDHSKCLKPSFGNIIIPIPADKIEAVESIISEYDAELSRRVDASIKADRDHHEHVTAVNKIMDR